MLHQKHREAEIMATTAAEIMTKPAIVVSPLASVGEIATLLAKNRISAVPVCGADGHLMGLISEGDLLRPFRESVRQKRDWWLGLLADGEELSQEYLDYMRIDTRNAQDVMVPHVITTTEDATLPELAELLVNNHIKRLPVLRDGQVVGVVSRSDVLAALARAPAMLD
jgi:CBS domain-containing protein